ncbi:PaaX family transcriptional regulator C-terminal domain-containing protein [Mycolicibacterium sp. 120266]|uniref:PaaX family transcriptional regulator n=1 Tax=Mycolicibacterium sp. 120266 TaxID=3090601 RepID=UPI00299DB49F|nr:PaaX family transcriptional regulator C-terminal domain-containing protein [Mycolicibacterium sp. 120266]MDX1876122.1 PaaX family transcriptional regulator C-terminal domain-containing protein [Mycolicibacterium sp. 120266]
MTSAASEESAPFAANAQSLLLTFFGMHLLGRPVAVSGSSLVDVFTRLGIGGSATRSLLARMTDRGIIERHKIGRKTYYALTPHGTDVLAEGSRKVWRGGDRPAWDGTWTSISASVPEAFRPVRHRLRARLSWAGFGLTRSGLWVAPGRHDVPALLGNDIDHVDITVVVGAVAPPTTDEMLVRDGYDLSGTAALYEDFSAFWSEASTARPFSGALVTRIRLQAHWLAISRTDPLLPDSLLPRNWPARSAEELFRRLDTALAAAHGDDDVHIEMIDLV